jgi:hypothetical protein
MSWASFGRIQPDSAPPHHDSSAQVNPQYILSSYKYSTFPKTPTGFRQTRSPPVLLRSGEQIPRVVKWYNCTITFNKYACPSLRRHDAALFGWFEKPSSR